MYQYANPIKPNYPDFYFPELRDPTASPVLLVPNFLNYSEIAEILSSAVDNVSTASKLGVSVQKDVTEIMEYARVTELIDADLSVLNAEVQHVNELISQHWKWDEELAYKHGWQCMAYKPGAHYRSHCDNSALVEPYELVFPERVFSIVIYLNDWTCQLGHDTGTFEGGELVFTHLVNEATNERLTVYPKAGTLAIFPSNLLFRHQVNVVRAGLRVSLVNWIGRLRDF